MTSSLAGHPALLLIMLMIVVMTVLRVSPAVDAAFQSVHEGREPAGGMPSFVRAVGNVSSALGRDVTLSCVVRNLGRYRVGWLKADTKTILTLHRQVVTKNSRVSLVDDAPNTWTLRVRQLRRNDAGCYMCQINTQPMHSQLGCIDVHVPPDIISVNSSNDVAVREGDNTRLVCHARGHPAPVVTWRREDSAPIFHRGDFRNGLKVYQVEGAVLELRRITRRQMTAYLCIARNIVPPAISKRIFVSVNFGPEVSVQQHLMGTVMRRDASLECLVQAHPTTVNYWLSNRDEMLLGGQAKYTLTEQQLGYKVHMKLHIHSVQTGDIGRYTCVATNSLGTAKATVQLYHVPRAASHVPRGNGRHNRPSSEGTKPGNDGRSAETSGSCTWSASAANLLVLVAVACLLMLQHLRMMANDDT